MIMMQSCQVELVEFLESSVVSRSRRDSVGRGVVAELFRVLHEPTRFSGGGVVAEFFEVKCLPHIQ